MWTRGAEEQRYLRLNVLTVVPHRCWTFRLTDGMSALGLAAGATELDAHHLIRARQLFADPNSSPAERGSFLFAELLPPSIQTVLEQERLGLIVSSESDDWPWPLLRWDDRWLALDRPVGQYPETMRWSDALEEVEEFDAPERHALVASDDAHLAEPKRLAELLSSRGFQVTQRLGPRELTRSHLLKSLAKAPHEIVILFARQFIPHELLSTELVLSKTLSVGVDDCRSHCRGEPLFVFRFLDQPIRDAERFPETSIWRDVLQPLAHGNVKGRLRAAVAALGPADEEQGVLDFFLEELVERRSLGAAMHRARARVGDADPNRWINVTLYGDPRLTQRDPSGRDRMDDDLADLAGGPLWGDDARLSLLGAFSMLSRTTWPIAGSAHLLCGLLGNEDNLLGMVLKGLKSKPANARRHVEKILYRDNRLTSDGLVQMDAVLRQTLLHAKEIATRSRGKEISDRHLLAALLEQPDCGAVTMLGVLDLDLARLQDVARRDPLAATAPESAPSAHQAEPTNASGSADKKVLEGEVLLPDGRLNSDLFEAGCLAAVLISAEMAQRTYWDEIRSPHLFLGVLARPDGILAVALKGKGHDPQSLTDVLYQLVGKPPRSVRSKPLVHREFVSDNALGVLQRAKGIARSAGRSRIGERDLLQAIIADESNYITQVLRQLKIDPLKVLG